MNTWATTGAEANRRRSQRVILSIPITVSGESSQEPFEEKTQTLVINVHGALITLAAKISAGQKLQLSTGSNTEKQMCRVVYVGPTADGKTQFGIEFTEPAPHFWHITFPPEGWTPIGPDKPAVPAKPTKG